jgi:hypothetical protein
MSADWAALCSQEFQSGKPTVEDTIRTEKRQQASEKTRGTEPQHLNCPVQPKDDNIPLHGPNLFEYQDPSQGTGRN